MDAGEVLRSVRRLRGVSGRRLSEIAGVPRATVERIEAGRNSPRIDTLSKLLDALGCELVVQTKMGRPIPRDDDREQLRDGAGRHYPAHLPLEEMTSFAQGSAWWGWFRIAWQLNDARVPKYTYWQPRRRVLPVVGDSGWCLSGQVWDDAT